LTAILVSSVRDDVLPDVVREAAEAGLDWALLNEGTFIDEIRDQYPSRAIFVVSPDQLEIGRIHGRQVRALVGDEGKVLCVTGPLTTVTAQQRLDGLKEILAGDFSLIELNADWTSERARMGVERWAAELVADSELPAMFVAHNDEMALGLVREGRIKATVIMPPASGAAIEWIARARTRDERPPVRVLQPVTSFPNVSGLKR
jgi:ABC-type sugar transport system substrate-binding protein